MRRSVLGNESISCSSLGQSVCSLTEGVLMGQGDGSYGEHQDLISSFMTPAVGSCLSLGFSKQSSFLDLLRSKLELQGFLLVALPVLRWDFSLVACSFWAGMGWSISRGNSASASDRGP